MAKWVKVTPGAITGYFKGKRIKISEGDTVEDTDIVRIYPQDFRPLRSESAIPPSEASPSSSPVEEEPSVAPPFRREDLEKLSKKELLEVARKIGINTDNLKKAELIEAILEAQRNE